MNDRGERESTELVGCLFLEAGDVALAMRVENLVRYLGQAKWEKKRKEKELSGGSGDGLLGSGVFVVRRERGRRCGWAAVPLEACRTMA